jgi:hypothetical protein
MNDDILNELFVLRLYYSEYIHNEADIIYKLKQRLADFNIPTENFNNYLYIFYNTFDIPITLTEIEAVEYNMFNISNNLIITIYDNLNNINDNLNNIINETEQFLDEEIPLPPINIYETNILDLLNNIITTNLQPMQDIVVTTNEESLNKIDTLKITKDMVEKCSICLVDMEENDEYLNIECKHIYHKDCLTTYLKNYNHNCPVCRKDIGDSHINY